MADEINPANQEAHNKPLIAVSRCLLGDRVRHDGGSNRVVWITDVLSQHCHYLPLCPEVEAGLEVPRPVIRLSGSDAAPRAILTMYPEQDITEKLSLACATLVAAVARADGMILKARSPSCGISDSPISDPSGTQVWGAGLFTRACQTARPGIPIIDETGLETEAERVGFLIQVFRYHCRRREQTPGAPGRRE